MEDRDVIAQLVKAKRWGRAGSGVFYVCPADGTVFLQKRSAKVLEPGTWGVTGGAVKEPGLIEEFYESSTVEAPAFGDSQLLDSALREVREELGVEPPDGELIGQTVYAEGGFRYTTFIIAVSAEQKEQFDADLKPSAEVAAAGWFKPGDFPEPLHFGLEYTLENFDLDEALGDESLLKTYVELGKDREFEEKHPRDEQGKFSEGNGSKADGTGTPEFKAWFGDSKVTDKEGNPLVVYHGSEHDQGDFKVKANVGMYGRGYYFTSDPEIANRYAWKTGSVTPAYISLQNPFLLDQLNAPDWYIKAKDKDRTSELTKRGYDGILESDGKQGFSTVVAFDRSQIKSSLDSSITKSLLGKDSQFEEKHPRDDSGRFAAGSGVVGQTDTKAFATEATRTQTTLTPDERSAKIVQLKTLRAQYEPLAQKGSLTRSEADQFVLLTNQANALRFDLAKPLALSDIPPAGERQSTLPSEIVLIARNDLLSNKAAYMSVTEAASGVSFASDTAVDRVMKGEDTSITAIEFYNTFSDTRQALRNHYGDTVHLFRAVGQQQEKPTQNWATTRKYAAQFGSKIIERDVPVDDVIAVNVGLSGKYHEFIIGNHHSLLGKNRDFEEKHPRDDSGKFTDGSGAEGQKAAYTDSPKFKAWFGDSKVLDSSGKPLVVYHGTRSDFSEFDRSKLDECAHSKMGFYFTASTEAAARFAGYGKGAVIMPVFLRMANPLVFDYYKQEEPHAGIATIIREALGFGKDGVILKNSPRFDGGPEHDVYIVFEPEQVKSATGNNGSFEPQQKDITKALPADDAELLKAYGDDDHGSRAWYGDMLVSLQSLQPEAFGEQLEKSGFEESHVARGKTGPGTNSGSFAPRDSSGQAAETPVQVPNHERGQQSKEDGGRPVPVRSFRVDPAARGQDFQASIAAAAASQKFGAAVEVKAVEFYADPATKLFLTPDGKAGAAVSSDGDLVSVFKAPKTDADINGVLREAAKHAQTLDGFDIRGFLPNKYAQFGFQPVARLPWNREYAPAGWDYASGGEPDVVFMVRDPEGVLPGPKIAEGNYESIRQQVPLFTDYEQAKAAQQQAKELVAAGGRAHEVISGELNEAYERLKQQPSRENAETYHRLKAERDALNPVSDAAPAVAQDNGGRQDYVGQHQAPMRDSGSPAHDLKDVYPEDFYGSNGTRYYADETDPKDRQSVSLVQSLRGHPNAVVTIYRAVPDVPTNAERIERYEEQKRAIQRRGRIPKDADPAGPKESSSAYYNWASEQIDRLKTAPEPEQTIDYRIHPGDWVTINRDYAKEHGEASLNGKYRILSKRVRASEIFTDGNSIHEWGYDPKLKKSGDAEALAEFVAKEFDESEHTRDEVGRFTESGGGKQVSVWDKIDDPQSVEELAQTLKEAEPLEFMGQVVPGVHVLEADGKRKVVEWDGKDKYAIVEAPKDWLHGSTADGLVEQTSSELAEQFASDFWSGPGVVYHATDESNVDDILCDGLETRSQTRGMTNRGVGAAVFATVNEDSAHGGTYGDTVIEIDAEAMRRDGYRPHVEPEPAVLEQDARGALASALGIEDYSPEAGDGADDPDTVIIHGRIPAKYLRVAVTKSGAIAKTVRGILAKDAEFEAKHSRDEDGKFTEGAGSDSGAAGKNGKLSEEREIAAEKLLDKWFLTGSFAAIVEAHLCKQAGEDFSERNSLYYEKTQRLNGFNRTGAFTDELFYDKAAYEKKEIEEGRADFLKNMGWMLDMMREAAMPYKDKFIELGKKITSAQSYEEEKSYKKELMQLAYFVEGKIEALEVAGRVDRYKQEIADMRQQARESLKAPEPIYRGITLTQQQWDDVQKALRTVGYYDVAVRRVSSWTTREKLAGTFARYGQGGRSGKKSNAVGGMVIKAEVNKDNVLFHPGQKIYKTLIARRKSNGDKFNNGGVDQKEVAIEIPERHFRVTKENCYFV